MCARIYLNGDGMGKGTHLSLFFVVMKGQYDNILRWPFRQKVTFMMVDQGNREHVVDAFRPDPTSSSFKKPTHEMNIASGCPLFVALNLLENGNFAYVKDDCLFVKVIVDVSDLERI
ncbi:TNF receptor-associated factor 3-like [Amphiura filiformis]|uniref:TNF receptor-associated factor 3-like n=1 Tax=Amphiura filiformis TaxID=82378 RepID=UPI003B213B6B